MQESFGRDPFCWRCLRVRYCSGLADWRPLGTTELDYVLLRCWLDRGRFVWPVTVDGVVALTAAADELSGWRGSTGGTRSTPGEAASAQARLKNVLRCGRRKIASTSPLCDSISGHGGDGLESLPDGRRNAESGIDRCARGGCGRPRSAIRRPCIDRPSEAADRETQPRPTTLWPALGAYSAAGYWISSN